MLKSLMVAAVSLTALAGCAGFEQETPRYPDFEQDREVTILQGRLNCQHCPNGLMQLSLYEETPVEAPTFRLVPISRPVAGPATSQAISETGEIFELDGGQRYPNQQLLELVSPMNTRVMILLPIGQHRYRVLSYQGEMLTQRTIFTPVSPSSASDSQ